jgi:hypothetical protein
MLTFQGSSSAALVGWMICDASITGTDEMAPRNNPDGRNQYLVYLRIKFEQFPSVIAD